jgi:hypothetical protein
LWPASQIECANRDETTSAQQTTTCRGPVCVLGTSRLHGISYIHNGIVGLRSLLGLLCHLASECIVLMDSDNDPVDPMDEELEDEYERALHRQESYAAGMEECRHGCDKWFHPRGLGRHEAACLLNPAKQIPTSSNPPSNPPTQFCLVHSPVSEGSVERHAHDASNAAAQCPRAG